MRFDFLQSVRHVPWWLWLVYVCSSAGMIVLAFLKYHALLYWSFDLGIYHQVLWNTAHGRIFIGSFNDWTYLVDHREWLLIALTPLYWIWADPRMLLIAQSVWVLSGVFPVYAICKHVLHGIEQRAAHRLTIVSALLYATYPTVMRLQLAEFHFLVFLLPIILWSWYALLKRRLFFFWLCCIALLLVRDDAAFMVVGYGVFLLTDRKLPHRMAHGAGLIAVSVLWFIGMALLGRMLATNNSLLFTQLYDWMGNTMHDIVVFPFLHPVRFILHGMTIRNSVIALLCVLTTAGGVLWFPRVLIPAAFAALPYVLASNDAGGVELFYYHYGVTVVVWFFIALLMALPRMFQRLPVIPTPLGNISISTALLVSVLLLNVAAFGPHWELSNYSTVAGEDRQRIADVARQIPEGDAVYGSNRYWPLLASRQKLYPVSRLATGTEHFSAAPVQLQSVQWLFVEHTAFAWWAVESESAHRAMSERYQRIINDNQLEPVFVNELGVVYGSAKQRSEAANPIVINAITQPLETPYRVTPDLLLVGSRYDVTAAEVHLTYKKQSQASFVPYDPFAVYLFFSWVTPDGWSVIQQPRALGYGLWNPETLKEGETVTMRYPIVLPENADVFLTAGVGRDAFDLLRPETLNALDRTLIDDKVQSVRVRYE